jgi:hypothetical protein
VKPSKELSIGLIQVLLSRPPRLEEVLEYATKGAELTAEYLTRLPGFRLHLINLSQSKSYEEVDRTLNEALSAELHLLEDFLPENYLGFLKLFLEFYQMEYIVLSLSGAPGVVGSPSESSLVKLTGVSMKSLAAEYSSCAPRDMECTLMRFLERVREAYIKLREYESRALDAIKVLVAVRYFNYVKNSELLGLKLGRFEDLLARLGINPVVEIPLRRVLERLRGLSRAELTRYTVHEAALTYPLVKELLTYSGSLADILTLYLVNRYYELKVLRYSLLPRSLRRW